MPWPTPALSRRKPRNNHATGRRHAARPTEVPRPDLPERGGACHIRRFPLEPIQSAALRTRPDRAAARKKRDDANGLIAENRRARFEYQLSDTFETGIQLTGTEVKSLRQGQANIAESYVAIENGDLVLINANIPEYQQAGPFYNHEPRRPRRLLMHRKEIARLAQAVDRQGMTIVPLRLYFNERGLVKLQIAVAQGKKVHDKRETERKRDWQRQKARLLRDRG